jgi:hypothetical protein
VGREKLHFINTNVLSSTVGRWMHRFSDSAGRQVEAVHDVATPAAPKKQAKPRARHDRRPDHLSKANRAKRDAKTRRKEEILKRQREDFEKLKAANFVHERHMVRLRPR